MTTISKCFMNKDGREKGFSNYTEGGYLRLHGIPDIVIWDLKNKYNISEAERVRECSVVEAFV